MEKLEKHQYLFIAPDLNITPAPEKRSIKIFISRNSLGKHVSLRLILIKTLSMLLLVYT